MLVTLRNNPTMLMTTNGLTTAHGIHISENLMWVGLLVGNHQAQSPTSYCLIVQWQFKVLNLEAEKLQIMIKIGFIDHLDNKDLKAPHSPGDIAIIINTIKCQKSLLRGQCKIP